MIMQWFTRFVARPAIWVSFASTAIGARSAAQVTPSGDTTKLVMPELHLESVAFDADRGRLVLFGGSATLTGTWEWDGARWRLAADSASSPMPRVGAPMTYDPDRRRVVMFGGQSRQRGVGWLCDTWAFDGRVWKQDNSGPCPTNRIISSSLVYDSRRRSVLLVEGTTVGNDTVMRPTRLWRWTRDAWVLVDSTGPRRRGFSQVAFDDSRGVLVVPVLFGGDDGGVWEWDGQQWRHVRATGPSTRQTYALAFDPGTRRVLLLGGQGSSRGPYHDDAWSWDGAGWTEIVQQTPRPSGRGGPNLLRDVRGGRFIYLGGYDERGGIADLWIRDERGWTRWEAR
jgi:hypothetical protein